MFQQIAAFTSRILSCGRRVAPSMPGHGAVRDDGPWTALVLDPELGRFGARATSAPTTQATTKVMDTSAPTAAPAAAPVCATVAGALNRDADAGVDDREPPLQPSYGTLPDIEPAAGPALATVGVAGGLVPEAAPAPAPSLAPRPAPTHNSVASGSKVRKRRAKAAARKAAPRPYAGLVTAGWPEARAA